MKEPKNESVETWLQSIKTDLQKIGSELDWWSIWRVPDKIRKQNEDAYSPHIISIGPLHHKSKNVLAMEVHKYRYTLYLLKRWFKVDDALSACGRVILALEKRVRACYGEDIGYYNERELAKMILLDGCFIIELFLRNFSPIFKLAGDSIFATSWMFSTLQRDLALLENQIPFFVLESLFELLDPSQDLETKTTLTEMAVAFFQSSFPIFAAQIQSSTPQISHLLHLIHYCCVPSTPPPINAGQIPSSTSQISHLLHLIHHYCGPSPGTVDPNGENASPGTVDPNGENASQFIHCAKSLSDAGIQFKKSSNAATFQLAFENGVFKIPKVRIYHSTASLFRNLIAFEQRLEDRDRGVTSYFILMDRLIDNARDVELLVDKQIIENTLGNWEEVSDFFNNICKHVVLREAPFSGLCRQVNTYYNERWHRYKADFKRNYLTNPWTIISLVAAFVLLSLTFLQTLYSMLSYYHPR